MEYFHCKMWIWTILILITYENVTKYTRCRVYLFTNLGYKTCIGIFCVGLFCGQVCQSRHHTTILGPLLYSIIHTMYLLKIIMYKFDTKEGGYLHVKGELMKSMGEKWQLVTLFLLFEILIQYFKAWNFSRVNAWLGGWIWVSHHLILPHGCHCNAHVPL